MNEKVYIPHGDDKKSLEYESTLGPLDGISTSYPFATVCVIIVIYIIFLVKTISLVL